MPKSAFPHWIYDGSVIEDTNGDGERAVQFLRALRHPASNAPKGRFQLYDFQERMTMGIHGPRNPDGSRKVRTAFVMLPRGSRKTSLAAGWGLLHTIGPEARPAGQAIFAASDREQAGIGFKEAANIIREDRRLVAATRIYDAHNSAKKIICRPNKAELLAVSSDGAAQHGKTPSFVLVDEIHAWKGRDLWEALKSGMAKVPDTLMIIATTAGRGQENIGFELYDYARKVATGEIDDPSFLPIIFEAEPGEDWKAETVWHKVNPGLTHGFPDLGGLRTMAREAEHRPAERFAFQQFHLNIWQAASRDPLFDMAVYDAGRDPNFDLADLEGLPCWLGVDLSRSGDLTAIVAAFRRDDGRISLHPWFFLPSEGLEDKAKLEQVPYPRWRDERLLNVIEGPVIEPDVIADQVIDLCGTYDVQEVIFDPSLAGPIMAKLVDHGINVLQLPQTAKHMHGPICDLERAVNGRRIRHGAHPILRNHFESVVVKRATSASELTTMHKGTRHSNHIDGAIASALAVFRAAANDNQRSIHELDPEEYDRLFREAEAEAA
ncbi:terminase large subunit [Sinorhizobium medicae]|uniref:terminase large subunit n=1 Tax=Sinorhizobium medicae TaxID=110321 RepID=UPI000FD9DC61|nr:terminase TerL endonuclease subunit [Sinorhizobium medicae]MDX0605406.1 terminase large subunit [Sinorhizobium medicae]MDX0821663.1 terminase large subunit [Sinorhizobium medicae]MDX0864744.1 terminase large subunit [Sinorhizobium medicae]RVJ19777.1 terminase large subunit [Sinorhizobium medicae]